MAQKPQSQTPLTLAVAPTVNPPRWSVAGCRDFHFHLVSINYLLLLGLQISPSGNKGGEKHGKASADGVLFRENREEVMRLGGGDVILWPGVYFIRAMYRWEVPDGRIDEMRMRMKMAMVTMITVSSIHQTNIRCPPSLALAPC